MDSIKLTAAKEVMRQTRRAPGGVEPVPFTMVFCTCDESRQTGGELRKVVDATLSAHTGSIPKAFAGSGKSSSPVVRIFDPASGHVIPVHYRLITEFNGKEVIW